MEVASLPSSIHDDGTEDARNGNFSSIQAVCKYKAESDPKAAIVSGTRSRIHSSSVKEQAKET